MQSLYEHIQKQASKEQVKLMKEHLLLHLTNTISPEIKRKLEICNEALSSTEASIQDLLVCAYFINGGVTVTSIENEEEELQRLFSELDKPDTCDKDNENSI
jgi:hypothetical protein